MNDPHEIIEQASQHVNAADHLLLETYNPRNTASMEKYKQQLSSYGNAILLRESHKLHQIFFSTPLGTEISNQTVNLLERIHGVATNDNPLVTPGILLYINERIKKIDADIKKNKSVSYGAGKKSSKKSKRSKKTKRTRKTKR
jgi:hypothetical protein